MSQEVSLDASHLEKNSHVEAVFCIFLQIRVIDPFKTCFKPPSYKFK